VSAETPEQAGKKTAAWDGTQAGLRRLIRERWNEALTAPADTGVDYAMASLAAETVMAAFAAQQPQPSPEPAAVTAQAITAGQRTAHGEDADHYDPGDYADDDGERDTARRMDALDEAARLEDRL